MADTLTQQQLLEQISKMTAQIEALTTLVAPKAKSKKTSADSSAPSAEKKKRTAPDASAWNAQVSSVWEEMKAAYRSANPSAEGLSDEEIRKQKKEGKLPPLPTYAQAMSEASRRKKAEDPEHAKKAEARRAQIDAKQAEEKKEKKSTKKTAPSPKPSEEPSPKPSAEPKITTFAASDDAEEFNMRLEMSDSKTYLLNAKNWVCTEDGTWVGIWNPENKTLDTSAAEPE
jgi:hypothetical protein